MRKNRLEAFSDGVLAIIITIMVLEMKVPHGGEINDIKALLPLFVSYILSFVNIGLYWNNHHHLFQAVEKVDGKVLWANTHLLFWLSLLPFATAWMGENHFSQWPVVLYGAVLLMCGTAYFILEKTLLRLHKRESLLHRAIKNNLKEKLSVFLYCAAVALAFTNSYISLGLYFVVAVMWFIPDKRIEKTGGAEEEKKDILQRKQS